MQRRLGVITLASVVFAGSTALADHPRHQVALGDDAAQRLRARADHQHAAAVGARHHAGGLVHAGGPGGRLTSSRRGIGLATGALGTSRPLLLGAAFSAGGVDLPRGRPGRDLVRPSVFSAPRQVFSAVQVGGQRVDVEQAGEQLAVRARRCIWSIAARRSVGS